MGKATGSPKEHSAPQGGPAHLELAGAPHGQHSSLPALAPVPSHAPDRALPCRAVQHHPQLPAACSVAGHRQTHIRGHLDPLQPPAPSGSATLHWDGNAHQEWDISTAQLELIQSFQGPTDGKEVCRP